MKKLAIIIPIFILVIGGIAFAVYHFVIKEKDAEDTTPLDQVNDTDTDALITATQSLAPILEEEEIRLQTLATATPIKLENSNLKLQSVRQLTL